MGKSRIFPTKRANKDLSLTTSATVLYLIFLQAMLVRGGQLLDKPSVLVAEHNEMSTLHLGQGEQFSSKWPLGDSKFLLSSSLVYPLMSSKSSPFSWQIRAQNHLCFEGYGLSLEGAPSLQPISPERAWLPKARWENAIGSSVMYPAEKRGKCGHN